jgi:hypothetical protein
MEVSKSPTKINFTTHAHKCVGRKVRWAGWGVYLCRSVLWKHLAEEAESLKCRRRALDIVIVNHDFSKHLGEHQEKKGQKEGGKVGEFESE